MGANPQHVWADLPADDIRDIAGRAGSTLVLPIGSMEQHGPHLPVSTDSRLVEAVTAGAMGRLPDDAPVIRGPTHWAGYSPHHLQFGGTMSLEFRTLLSVVEELADSALENGFDAFVLVNGHGGNIPLISAATSTIGRAHPEIEALSVTYISFAEAFVEEVRESEPGGMGHGGEFETSLMLHLHPELVREDLIDGTPLDEPYERGLTDIFAGGTLGVYRPFEDYSETGAIGNPELASESKGRELADGLADELAAQFTEIHERNRDGG